MAGRRQAVRPAYHHGNLRAELMAAALDLVRRDGAAGFSLREAARAVGVDPAACYRHFRDRQAVLIAIAQEGFLKLSEVYAKERARLAEVSPRERIFGLGRAYLAFALRQPAEFRIMFGDSGLHARDERLRHPNLPQSAYEQLELEVGVLAATTRLTQPPASVALVLWSSVHGLTRLVLDGAVPLEEKSAQELLTLVMTATLDGLASHSRAKTRAGKARRGR